MCFIEWAGDIPSRLNRKLNQMSNIKEMQAQLAMMAAAIAAMAPEEVATTAPVKTPRGKAKPTAKEEAQQAPLPTESKTPLHVLREECVDQSIKAGGKTQRYADGIAEMLRELNKTLKNPVNVDLTFWGEIPLAGEVPEHMIPIVKAINAEKRSGMAAAKSRGHKNPTQWWKQVREKAYRPTDGGDRKVRTIDDVLKPELEKLYKRAWQNQSELGKQYRPLFDGLAALLKDNGVILATLHKKADTRFKTK